MRRGAARMLAVLACALLAGCTLGDAPPEEATGGMSVDEVRVVRVPEASAPGAEVEACWRVEGTGVIADTFLVADGSRVPASDPTGPFALPATFCATFVMPEATTRVHAEARGSVADLAGPSSEAHGIQPEGTGVWFSTDVPEEAAPGESVRICWMAAGEGSSPHTAIHTSRASRAEADTFAAYEGAAHYPEGGDATTQGDFALPGPFCALVDVPEDADAIHLRAHAVMPGEGFPGRLNDVEQRVRITSRAAPPPV